MIASAVNIPHCLSEVGAAASTIAQYSGTFAPSASNPEVFSRTSRGSLLAPHLDPAVFEERCECGFTD
jgi:hypothetical protein